MATGENRKSVPSTQNLTIQFDAAESRLDDAFTASFDETNSDAIVRAWRNITQSYYAFHSASSLMQKGTIS